MKNEGMKIFTLALVFMLALAGCAGDDGAAGPAGSTGPAGPAMPVIQSLSSDGLPADPGGSVTLVVNADSAEGLALTYAWTTDPPAEWVVSGAADTDTLVLTAPMGYGAGGSATVAVTDSDGRVATGMITLSTVGNGSPVIQSITAYPQPVYTSANLLCSASDPNGDAMGYSWTVGGITGIAAGSSAVWNSPGIPGYYLVNVSVSDAFGGSAMGSTSLSISSVSPWPRRGGNIQSTGLSPVDTRDTANTQKWNIIPGGSVVSSPAIGPDGTIYVGSWGGGLYSVTPGGAVNWASGGSGGGVFTPNSLDGAPVVGADGTIYVGMRDGFLYAVNSVDGSRNWRTDVGFSSSTLSSYSAPALGADGTIYVSTIVSNSVYAVNPDGTEKWNYALANRVYSSPALGADGTIYVGSIDNSVHAINPDGTLKWSYNTGEDINSSASVGADGTVYIGSISNSLYAISPDGSLMWSFDTGEDISLSSPAIGADGTIYIGSVSNSVYAVSREGTLSWSYETGDNILSSPAIGADGTIYVGSYDNSLYAFNPDGSVKWEYATTGDILSSPAIGPDGTVYIGQVGGTGPWFHAVR